MKQRLMLFLGAALPATHEGGPTSCRKGPTFQMHNPASVVGCAYVFPAIACIKVGVTLNATILHRGCSQSTISRVLPLLSLVYVQWSIGYVRYTKVGFCETKLVG